MKKTTKKNRTIWVLKRRQDASLKELWVGRRWGKGWCARSGVKGTARLPLLSVWAGLCVVVWPACSLFCFQTYVTLEWSPSARTLCYPRSVLRVHVAKPNRVQTSRLRTQLTLFFHSSSGVQHHPKPCAFLKPFMICWLYKSRLLLSVTALNFETSGHCHLFFFFFSIILWNIPFFSHS